MVMEAGPMDYLGGFLVSVYEDFSSSYGSFVLGLDHLYLIQRLF